MRALFLASAAALSLLAQPALAQTGRDAFNSDLQRVWDDLRPGLQQRLYDEANTQLLAVKHDSSIAKVSVRKVNGMGFSMQNAPGLAQLAHDQVGLRVPLNGRWGLEVEAEVRAKLNLWIFRPTIDIPIKLIVEKLKLDATVDLDLTDPARPSLVQVARPNIDFKLKLRSRNLLWNLLFTLLSPVGNHFAKKAVRDALDDLMPQLASLQGMPGPVPGDGAPPLQDSGAATPFADVAAGVDDKIRRDHLPHGLILMTVHDQPQTDSWLDAYRTGGTGSAGNIVQYGSGGDSAIWTGHYLASQAYRYNVTGDPQALDNVRHALEGLGKLLDVNGATGLLARNAAPETSLVGQNIQRKGAFGRQQINGVTWIGRQGDHGISRDQYSGVYFGMLATYDLVNDAAIKAECARRLQMMLDYKIARDWIIDEDRPAFDGVSRSGFPTFWAGIAYQKLAFLLIGERVNPGKYAADLAAASPLASTAWLGAWTGGFGLDHYYKFNLSHIGYFNYFKLETDPGRWQEMNRAFRMITRYVGHHRNAHFDLIRTSIDPSSKAVLFPQTREVMRRFLTRNHREVAPPVVDLSNVTWQTVTLSGYVNPSAGSGAALTSATVQVPSEPLDFDQRRYTGNFHWQRNPFDPAVPNQGNPRAEKHGLDVVLPYWMGRHFGAF